MNDVPPKFKKRKYEGFMSNDLSRLRNNLQVKITKERVEDRETERIKRERHRHKDRDREGLRDIEKIRRIHKHQLVPF